MVTPNWGPVPCQDDPEPFFPERGGPATAAARVCAACPMKAPCLQFAIDNGEQHGIWGGVNMSEHAERQRQIRVRKIPSPRKPMPTDTRTPSGKALPW